MDKQDKILRFSKAINLNYNKDFHFDFHCERCETGSRMPFKPSLAIAQVFYFKSAFNGVLGDAADIKVNAIVTTQKKSHNNALKNRQTNETKPFPATAQNIVCYA